MLWTYLCRAPNASAPRIARKNIATTILVLLRSKKRRKAALMFSVGTTTKMATDIKEIVERLDEMMAAALPKDHSAPLGPVIEAGCYLTRVWPIMRKKLLDGIVTE